MSSVVGYFAEHPVILIVTAIGVGWLVTAAALAVLVGRMIALAEEPPRHLTVVR